jgi:hypothetical protein
MAPSFANFSRTFPVDTFMPKRRAALPSLSGAKWTCRIDISLEGMAFEAGRPRIVHKLRAVCNEGTTGCARVTPPLAAV